MHVLQDSCKARGSPKSPTPTSRHNQSAVVYQVGVYVTESVTYGAVSDSVT